MWYHNNTSGIRRLWHSKFEHTLVPRFNAHHYNARSDTTRSGHGSRFLGNLCWNFVKHAPKLRHKIYSSCMHGRCHVGCFVSPRTRDTQYLCTDWFQHLYACASGPVRAGLLGKELRNKHYGNPEVMLTWWSGSAFISFFLQMQYYCLFLIFIIIYV